MKKINIQSGGIMKTVYVNVVIDESGSMAHRRASVISGVNEYVNDLKDKNDDINYVLNVIKFNTFSSFAVENLPISKFETFSNYSPNGGTALYDAVGDAIVGTDKLNATNAIFIIMTDGEENSSKRFDSSKVKSMIEDRQSKGWAFTYLGADSNTWSAAGSIGINMQNAVMWDTKNVGGTFRAASAMTSSFYTSCNVNNNDIYTSAGIADFNKLAEELK